MKAVLLVLPLVACSSPAKPHTESPTMPPTTTDTPAPVPAATTTPAAPVEDPYLWLEDVEGAKSLAWARERNQQSERELTAVASFAKTRDRIRAILDSKDKIPSVTKRGGFYYNFWQDEANPRGVI